MGSQVQSNLEINTLRMKIIFSFLALYDAITISDDGKFQIKLDDVDGRWTNQCLTLQHYYKPGGYNPSTGAADSDLPAAIITACDDNNEGQFFEYDNSLQLKAVGNCLTFSNMQGSANPCIYDTSTKVGSQLYTTECLPEELSQKWVFADGKMKTLCAQAFDGYGGGLAISAASTPDNPVFEDLGEDTTVSLVLSMESTTLDFVPLTGLEAVLTIPIDEKHSSWEDNLRVVVGSTDIPFHGCYCSVMDSITDFIKHGETIDAMDTVCKEWWQMTHCNRKSSVCDGFIFSHKTYTLHLGVENPCDLNEGCAKDQCLVDQKYASQVLMLYDDNFDNVPGSEDLCVSNVGSGTRTCSGVAPDFEFLL